MLSQPMRLRAPSCAFFVVICLSSLGFGQQSGPGENPRAASHRCLSLAEAAFRPDMELCVSAHVYDVVELPDGTRFLDVCPPSLPDAECGFTIVSLRDDRAEVGDLRKLRNQDVHIRGMVRLTHGRMGMTLSHARQLSGGPEKFRPNPLLARNFDGQSNRMPVKDPNLSASGRHRAFMNNREQEPTSEAR
jgi:hypothetical protein